jgi:hypothetical protein
MTSVPNRSVARRKSPRVAAGRKIVSQVTPRPILAELGYDPPSMAALEEPMAVLAR